MAAPRSAAEPRVVLGNEQIRIDFDPRTSDTMYNYIWVRRPDSGAWERVHNFGVDVRSYKSESDELVNTIGMDLDIQIDGPTAQVSYPEPLIVYRQFDDKIGSPESVARYPDQKRVELPGLVHADASIRFTFVLDGDRPSFVLSGQVLSGRVRDAVHIISALWTENEGLPTHVLYQGFSELEYGIFDIHAHMHRDVEVENMAYVIFYRSDGNGVPFALMPIEPVRAGVNNYFDNWNCMYDFRTCSMNQHYIVERPVYGGSNDSGYTSRPDADGRLPGLRVVFFPELGWIRGGTGHILRSRVERSIVRDYLGGDAAGWWDGRRPGNPKLTLSSPLA